MRYLSFPSILILLVVDSELKLETWMFARLLYDCDVDGRVHACFVHFIVRHLACGANGFSRRVTQQIVCPSLINGSLCNKALVR